MWIERDISDFLLKNSDPVQVLQGPRQCGKSSLLFRLDPSFREISLDDPALRELAQSDPELFLKQFAEEKLFIDEVQYAPALFPSIKRRVDLARRQGERAPKTLFRLTGSNQILMDRNIHESLAGRASFFKLNTLSVSEVLRAFPGQSIQDILYRGGWPELYVDFSRSVKKYIDDYVSSYVEKDVVLAAGIQKSAAFLRATRLLAGRVGQILEYAGLSRDCGVDAKTLKEWVSVLERMQLVALVQPFSSNLSKRLVKSPKFYFLDTGLACRLQGWTSADPIVTSPQQGALFENLVFSEIQKLNQNAQLGLQVFYFRTREGEEIDFLIEASPNRVLLIEAKVARTSALNFNLNRSSELRKIFGSNLPEVWICHQEGEGRVGNSVPIRFLASELLHWASSKGVRD